jgi:hypothetical protein
MMDMNMAATKTTLTATFSLTRAAVRVLPDRGWPATTGCVLMMSAPTAHPTRQPRR